MSTSSRPARSTAFLTRSSGRAARTNTSPGAAQPPLPSLRMTAPAPAALCGNHESAGCCVLLELTHRCDLRCPVCFASAGGEGDLTIDEVAALYDMLMERGGPYNIQLSGGEPT